MLRTQIYLPENQVDILKALAYQEKVSVSEIIRNIIETELNTPHKKIKTAKKNAGQWLLLLAKEAKLHKVFGPKDLAANLDKYLYGV